MKKLMRIKLINWHRFLNETIEVKNSVLLSGENGAGKSTILDAVQLVLTCSKNNFNKAANENGKRTLAGYIRCKTGKESKPYEREGMITGHVALEFFEETKKKSFIIGAIIDSSSEHKEKTVWYRIENESIEEELFFMGNKPKNIDLFKKTNKKIQSFNSPLEAKRDFSNKLGRLYDKFFDLIPKALAFKPIDDIKDFVYSYVLDKKEVNIEVLKENVRNYQELDKILQNIKVKISKLENISMDYEKIKGLQERVHINEYFVKRADVEISKKEIENLKKSVTCLEEEVNKYEKNIVDIQNEIDRKNSLKSTLELELSSSTEYIAMKKLEEDINRINREITLLKKKKTGYSYFLKEQISICEKVLCLDIDFKEVREYSTVLKKFQESLDTSLLKEHIQSFVKVKDKKYDLTVAEKTEKESEKKEIDNKLMLVNKRIKLLENKKLEYDEKILRLIKDIKDNFKAVGKEINPRILCELLRITDGKWKNAIEGYLNTQRFYILVEPEHFDLALKIYEKSKKENKIHSVGLINTGKLEDYNQCNENSLADVVASQSIWAKRYANMILGKVMKCEKAEELKKHKCAITPECMLYQNHVVRAINPKIYRKPYIGEDAYKIQLQQAKDERENLETNRNVLEEIINKKNEYIKVLKSDNSLKLEENIDVLPRFYEKEEEVKKLKEEKITLEKNNNYIDKMMKIENINKEMKNLEKKKDNVVDQRGRKNNEIENSNKKIEEKKILLNNQIKNLKEKEEELTQTLIKAEKEYENILKTRSIEAIKQNYTNRITRVNTEINNAKKDLRDKQYEYKSEHDFGAEATLEGVYYFIEELNKLKGSEVLNYEEKVQNAKKSAEQEFKEQFLAKIQENIKKAQNEFKHLNNSLKNINFGSERYEFKIGESKKYGRYYKMIMDDFNLVEGFSLLSGEFNKKHKEVIDELFEKLTLDEYNSSKALEEYTDYRTYMDYDILVTLNDSSNYWYSKVCKEKSGGETQTPFYVTIAASFLQLYSQGIGESIGIIMFDEAFDKMDDERIDGVLEFLTQLPLQMIIAAPPDKIQYIGPWVNSTLLVLKDEEISYVEDFSYEKI